jgi:IPT/TIG domain
MVTRSDGAAAGMAATVLKTGSGMYLLRPPGLRDIEVRIGSGVFPLVSGGGRLMDGTHRGAGDVGAWQARRPVSAIVAVAGTVLFAVAGAGCGHGPGVSNIAAPAARGNSGSGCPTQGVGGDSLAPPCASPTTAPTGGTNGPPSPATQSAPASLGITPVAAPTQMPTPPSSSPGVAGPAVPTLTPLYNPQVTAVSPASGPGSGGESVTITGSGLTGATEVDFGGVRAVMTADSDTQITATSPPGNGTVDITVVTPNGTSTTSSADQFTYAG